MYGSGALVWLQSEYNALETKQNEMGRWIWDVGNVRNELVRGESGWSTFEEREAKAMMNCFVRMIFYKNIVADIGVSCLLELGGASKWWRRLQGRSQDLGGGGARMIFFANLEISMSRSHGLC